MQILFIIAVSAFIPEKIQWWLTLQIFPKAESFLNMHFKTQIRPLLRKKNWKGSSFIKLFTIIIYKMHSKMLSTKIVLIEINTLRIYLNLS